MSSSLLVNDKSCFLNLILIDKSFGKAGDTVINDRTLLICLQLQDNYFRSVFK